MSTESAQRLPCNRIVLRHRQETRGGTSVVLRHLCAPDEAQVTRARVRRVDVPSGKVRLEVVGVKRLVSIDRVVATRVVRTVHPDLERLID